MDDDDALSSTYQSANVYKGVPYEVIVKVPIRGCVLTWDFDIIKVCFIFIIAKKFAGYEFEINLKQKFITINSKCRENVNL